MSKWMTGSWEVRSWATGGGAGPAAEEGEGRTLCLMGMPSPDLRSAGCGALHAAPFPLSSLQVTCRRFVTGSCTDSHKAAIKQHYGQSHHTLGASVFRAYIIFFLFSGFQSLSTQREFSIDGLIPSDSSP